MENSGTARDALVAAAELPAPFFRQAPTQDSTSVGGSGTREDYPREVDVNMLSKDVIAFLFLLVEGPLSSVDRSHWARDSGKGWYLASMYDSGT